MQSRKMSLVESFVNVAIGYGVAVASQVLIFPIFGIRCQFRDNLLIGLWFTVISIVRSYLLRRAFNSFRQIDTGRLRAHNVLKRGSP